VVELVKQGFECLGDIGKVLYPALLRLYRAGDMNLHTEGMAMEAPAFMIFRHIGQPVCGLNIENLENLHRALSGRTEVLSLTTSYLLTSGADLDRSKLIDRHKRIDCIMLPLLVETADLESQLGDPSLLIIDLCKPDVYAQGHIPGAVHLDYSKIIFGQSPAAGQIPTEQQLSGVFSAIGLTADKHVIAYDDEGGGRACRLLWTLDVIGHGHGSLLNGGLHAWTGEKRPLSNEAVMPEASACSVHFSGAALADKDYILAHLDDKDVVLFDARSADEYNGDKVFAARGGHIPGAINFEWTDAIDVENNLRLKPLAELSDTLASLGFDKDKETITYCQTHHRSSHSYILLKILGYKKIKGYPGSWSEWGNLDDTPIE